MDETLTPCKVQRQGGWRTFPYVIGGVSGVLMGTQGVTSNLLVYLIQQFNMKSIDATQIVSFVNGCSQLAPIIGAIIADAVGCFPILSASMAACLLSILMFMSTAAIPSLSPPSCSSSTLGVCEAPGGGQLAVLYLAIFLLVIGVGGNRLNSSTFGAKQMDSGEEQATFFNWFTVAMYSSLIVGTTALVYVEDNMGWVFGFGICAALCAVGLFVFHLGKNCYRNSDCRENPFVTLLRSLVRRFGKTKTPKSCQNDYERLEDGTGETKLKSSTSRESSLVDEDEVSTETEEEEEVLSSIIGLLPLMASIICTSLACTIQGSLATLQAMAMDRHLGSGFLIPAASTPIFTMAAAAACIPLLEGIVFRRWHVTPLQRIGASHFLTFISLAGTAVVESRRLASPESGAMSVLWMVPPLVLVGLGEALYFPAQLVFYFQEFPESLRSSSAGMTALMTGIGCYLSTTVITLIQRFTDWWRDDIDESRFDNVYWMLAVVVLINFGYFLICAVRYKNKGKAKI